MGEEKRSRPLQDGISIIYPYLVRYVLVHKEYPTRRRMCEDLGISSTSQVNLRLSALAREDWIDLDENGRISIPGVNLVTLVTVSDPVKQRLGDGLTV